MPDFNPGGYHFCTVTGKDYVLKVIALHHSLQQHTNRYHLWICCIDDLAYSILMNMNLEHLIPIHVKDIENERLRIIKGERKTNEYCWTLKAPFIKYLLETYDMESIIYLDGDLYFFSDPTPIYEEWGECSVFLCPQRDAEWVERKYGKYQAGLIGFRRDSQGMKPLAWWEERCLEWCRAEPDQEKFGDQKYLEQIADRFPDVHVKVSEHLGINAAPWNCIYNNDFTVTVRNNEIYINEFKLVAYHFACVFVFSESEFDLWSMDPLPISSVILNGIYVPYLQKIREVMKAVGSMDDHALPLCLSQNRSKAQTLYMLSI